MKLLKLLLLLYNLRNKIIATHQKNIHQKYDISWTNQPNCQAKICNIVPHRLNGFWFGTGWLIHYATNIQVYRAVWACVVWLYMFSVWIACFKYFDSIINAFSFSQLIYLVFCGYFHLTIVDIPLQSYFREYRRNVNTAAIIII